jgi:hypothetical protein
VSSDLDGEWHLDAPLGGARWIRDALGGAVETVYNEEIAQRIVTDHNAVVQLRAENVELRRLLTVGDVMEKDTVIACICQTPSHKRVFVVTYPDGCQTGFNGDGLISIAQILETHRHSHLRHLAKEADVTTPVPDPNRETLLSSEDDHG